MPPSHRRGPWVPEEDHLLMHLVHDKGPNNWIRISQHMHIRSPKQCRERFHQTLKPSLNRSPISSEEGQEIERLVASLGKRWAEIARRLGNRSDNAVKNWWNGSVNRKRRVGLTSGSSSSAAAAALHSRKVLNGRVESGYYYPRGGGDGAAAASKSSRFDRDRPTSIHVYSGRRPLVLDSALPSPAYSDVSSSSLSPCSSSSSPYAPSIDSPSLVPDHYPPTTSMNSLFLPPPVDMRQHYSGLRRKSLPSLMSDDGTSCASCPSSSASSPFLAPLSLARPEPAEVSVMKPCYLPAPGDLLSSELQSQSSYDNMRHAGGTGAVVSFSPPRDSRISLDKLLN